MAGGCSLELFLLAISHIIGGGEWVKRGLLISLIRLQRRQTMDRNVE